MIDYLNLCSRPTNAHR